MNENYVATGLILFGLQHSVETSVIICKRIDMAEIKDTIERVKAGHPDAFYQLIEDYKRLVYNIVFKMVSNDADREDICQDIFLKIYQHLASFQHESKLSTWIARISYNTCINALKKKKVPLFDDFAAEGDSIETLVRSPETPADVITDKDVSERLEIEIQELPPRFRTILTLYHIEEMSYAEIGKITDMPDGTVKSYLFRARKLLKERLAERYEQEELWH